MTSASWLASLQRACAYTALSCYGLDASRDLSLASARSSVALAMAITGGKFDQPFPIAWSEIVRLVLERLFVEHVARLSVPKLECFGDDHHPAHKQVEGKLPALLSHLPGKHINELT